MTGSPTASASTRAPKPVITPRRSRFFTRAWTAAAESPTCVPISRVRGAAVTLKFFDDGAVDVVHLNPVH